MQQFSNIAEQVCFLFEGAQDPDMVEVKQPNIILCLFKGRRHFSVDSSEKVCHILFCVITELQSTVTVVDLTIRKC